MTRCQSPLRSTFAPLLGLALGALSSGPALAGDCGSSDGAKFSVTLTRIACDDATDSMDADEVYVEVDVDGQKCRLGPYSLDTGDSTSPNVTAYFSMVSSWRAWEEDGGAYGEDDPIGTKVLSNTDRDGAHDETWSPEAGKYRFYWTKTTLVQPAAEVATTATEASTQPAVGGRVDVSRPQDKMALVLPAGASRCAEEGGTCTFVGKKRVFYGADGAYVAKFTDGSTACTQDAFGSDPAPGKAKACFVPTGRPVTGGRPGGL